MPRRCSICSHPERETIDYVLVAGEAYRNIAARFGTSATALVRHKNHIPAHLAYAKEAQEVSQADDLLAKVAAIEAEAKRIARKAEKAGNLGVAMSGVRELARLVELLAKLRGELQEGQTVNVLVMPEWQTVRAAIVSALAPFPQARIAVAKALEKIGNGRST